MWLVGKGGVKVGLLRESCDLRKLKKVSSFTGVMECWC